MNLKSQVNRLRTPHNKQNPLLTHIIVLNTKSMITTQASAPTQLAVLMKFQPLMVNAKSANTKRHNSQVVSTCVPMYTVALIK